MKLPRRKVAQALVLAATFLIGGGIITFLAVGRARQVAIQLSDLQPLIEKSRLEMSQAIQSRAIQQSKWLKKELLDPKNAEMKQLQEMADRLALIPFITLADFEQADLYQTEISDSIARRLASGTLTQELTKKIERFDMAAQRKRSEYFQLVQRQRILLNTPLLNHLESMPPQPAPIFPAEQVLLDQSR